VAKKARFALLAFLLWLILDRVVQPPLIVADGAKGRCSGGCLCASRYGATSSSAVLAFYIIYDRPSVEGRRIATSCYKGKKQDDWGMMPRFYAHPLQMSTKPRKQWLRFACWSDGLRGPNNVNIPAVSSGILSITVKSVLPRSS
jgi:hypothetical protein